MEVKHKIRIGLSACFFHPDPARVVFAPKTLLYFEETMARLVMSQGAFPVLMPREAYDFQAIDLLSEVDGLILQAGSDISPLHYKEKALKEDWEGDKVRDDYEIDLIHKAMDLNKPILGICRGLQIINVTFGGSLYQDIDTQVKTETEHRNPDKYDKLTHEVSILPETQLAKMYNGSPGGKVVSVHHQGIKQLGRGLVVEAYSKEDKIIEAIRYIPSLSEKTNSQGKEEAPYVFGIQWHPEYHEGKEDLDLLDARPIIQDFIEAIIKRKKNL